MPAAAPPVAIPGAGFVLCDDLMFVSKITGLAKQLDLVVQPARNSEVLLSLAQQQAPPCIFIDLVNPGLKIATLIPELRTACTAPPRIIAFGPHVDAIILRFAREAGCTEVFPRSKFVEELPRKMVEWMGGKDATRKFALANFDKVWQQAQMLTPGELRKLRSLIDNLLASQTQKAPAAEGMATIIPLDPNPAGGDPLKDWKPAQIIQGEEIDENVFRHKF